MKIAIVHYWLVSWRGGEKVLEQLLELYPNADLYTHVYNTALVSEKLAGKKIHTTFINKLPFAQQWYQKYVALMPYASEQLDMSEYDLVISSESGPAKNLILNPDATHICYCHSPMRYVWDMYHLYQKNAGFITRLLMKPIIHYLKIVDRLSADRVDHFIANSEFIARRIQKCYRRDATIIHPPLATEQFTIQIEKQDFYLYLGQLTHYKKADLIVEAFNISGKRLIIIGEGELEKKLKDSANSNITLLGKQDFNIVKQYLMNSKALIFPGVEDFGIVPLEATACGTPVIAYAKGGALETIVNNKTGVFFNEQTVKSLNACIEIFEKKFDIDIQSINEQIEKFSESNFKKNISKYISSIT